MRYYTWRQNFMEKCNKISSKMYKHLVQQKVQQKVRNNYVVLCSQNNLCLPKWNISTNNLNTQSRF